MVETSKEMILLEEFVSKISNHLVKSKIIENSEEFTFRIEFHNDEYSDVSILTGTILDNNITCKFLKQRTTTVNKEEVTYFSIRYLNGQLNLLSKSPFHKEANAILTSIINYTLVA